MNNSIHFKRFQRTFYFVGQKAALHDHPPAIASPLEPAHELKAVQSRHPNIKDHQVFIG